MKPNQTYKARAVAIALCGFLLAQGGALSARAAEAPTLTFNNTRNPTFLYQPLNVLKGARATDANGKDISSSIQLVASAVPTTTLDGQTVASESGSYTVTLTVTDSELNTTTKDFRMTINPPGWRAISKPVAPGSQPSAADFIDLGQSTYHPELYEFRWKETPDFETPGTRRFGIIARDTRKGQDVENFYVNLTIPESGGTSPAPVPPSDAPPLSDEKPPVVNPPTETPPPAAAPSTPQKKLPPGQSKKHPSQIQSPSLDTLPEDRDTTRSGIFITKPGERTRLLTPEDLDLDAERSPSLNANRSK